MEFSHKDQDLEPTCKFLHRGMQKQYVKYKGLVPIKLKKSEYKDKRRFNKVRIGFTKHLKKGRIQSLNILIIPQQDENKTMRIDCQETTVDEYHVN